MQGKLVFKENIGLNNIFFNVNRKKIHSIIGKPSNSFYKNANDKTLSEEYNQLGLFIYYDLNNNINAIEAWDEANIFFNDKSIFDMKYEDLLVLVKKSDNNLKVVNDGFISDKLGLIAWYEDEISFDSKLSSFTIFNENYIY